MCNPFSLPIRLCISQLYISIELSKSKPMLLGMCHQQVCARLLIQVSISLVFISSLGNEKWKLWISLFTCTFSASPGRIWTDNMSLERIFQKELNLVVIVDTVSVGALLLQVHFSHISILCEYTSLPPQ